MGPLGQPNEFLDKELTEFKEKKHIFIARGVRIVPIYLQVKWFNKNRIPVD